MVGTYIFALCNARVAIFNPHVQQAIADVSKEPPASFWVVLMRAVFAGRLLALMVWLLPGAESARMSIIVMVTYLIGLGGFNHIVAGSNKMFFQVVTGAESWSAFLTHFFFPTLLGNVVGGVSLVAFLGHAQQERTSRERRIKGRPAHSPKQKRRDNSCPAFLNYRHSLVTHLTMRAATAAVEPTTTMDFTAVETATTEPA